MLAQLLAIGLLDGAEIPTTPDIVEPVTVDLARMQCRLDDEFEDELIAQKIRAAREWCENHIGRAIVKRAFVVDFGGFDAYLAIFHRPVASIDRITYSGPDGEQTYSGAIAALGVYPLRILPGAGGWPALAPGGQVTVTYTAGYAPGEVPYRIVEAILVLVSGMMSEREGAYDTSINAAKSLLKILRQPVLA
jgi:uncharacterized phiE125 gp8 family phage protein